MTLSKLYSLFTPTLIGLLLGVGYIIPAFWWVGCVGVAWLISLLIRDDSRLRWYTVWYIWWIQALCFTSWLWAIYPIDWLGVSLGVYELPLIAFYWMTVGASLASGGIALYILVRIIKRYLNKFSQPQWVLFALVPFLWLIAELVSSFIFSLLLHGPGGTIGFAFTMGYSGYLLAEHGMLFELAQLGGVYILSFTYICIAVSGLWLYQQKQRRAVYLSLVVLVVSGAIQLSQPPTTEQGNTVAVVDTNWDTDDWTGERAASTSVLQREALNSATELNPDYIVFPEDSRLFNQAQNPTVLENYLRFTLNTVDAVVVDSSRTDFADETVMQVNLYDGDAGELAQSHKRYLVPQGEFMPYMYQFLFSLFDSDESTQMLSNRLDYIVGPNTSQAHYSPQMPGVLFCFEVVDARGVRRIVQERSERPPFIAHIISHAWINESQIFRKQLTTMLRVQASWNDVAIVSAGNFVPGEVIYANGSVGSLTPVTTLGKTTISTVTIPVVEQ